MKQTLAALLLATPLLALPDGYELSTWAEPFDVEYPTALTAAADGTVYVSVDRNGSIGKAKNMGKVVACTDTNGDGKADKFTDFVPNVDSPRGGHFVKDTLYLIHPPFLSSYRDTDGDGVADEHKVLLENIGFGLRHPRGSDHTTNGCRMGIDGWLYIAVGDFGMEGTKGTDGRVVTLQGGAVARVRPDGTDLEIYSHHTRNICDVAISPTLDLFTRDNTNDGKGWNIRVHHFTDGSEHGYPRLYKNFADEVVLPVIDLGGGSGTGALYLDEPGHPEVLLTCDWTTGKIYEEKLTVDGAGFKVEEVEFMDLVRAVDIDVDGSGNLYVCDWRNGRFTFAGKGKKVGFLQKLTKQGLKSEPFPNLTRLSSDDLVAQFMKGSAVRRLEVQREILARRDKSFAPLLVRGATSEAASLADKVAMIFTLRQLMNEDAAADLRTLAQDAVIRPWALRALGELQSATREDFQPHLKDDSSLVQLQAVVGLMRLRTKAAGSSFDLIALAGTAKDARIEHTIYRALTSIGETNVLLEASHQRAAKLALMRLHQPEVISGLVTKLEQAEGGERLNLIEILGRLYHQEAEWDLKSWWSTRPDDRGPYFAPVAWAETPRIKAALESVFETLSKDDQETMLGTLGRNRVPISEMKLGDQDPFLLALVTPTLDQSQIDILTAVAKDAKRPWADRVKGYRALGRVENDQIVSKQVEILGAWLDQGIRNSDVEPELSDFTNQPALILSTKTLRTIATKGSHSESRVAWRTLLTFTQSPLIKENQKDPIKEAIAKNPREEGLFLALSDLLLPGFDAQIENAINSDNDTLIEAAKQAREAIAKAKASTGKMIAELKPDEITKLAMAAQGNPKNGKLLFTRQGCIACHAVDQKAVQKGPYLGAAGRQFTKDYLIESVLNPNAIVAQGFQTEVVTMNDGTMHYGFVTREEDGIVDLRNIVGLLTQLKEGDIQKRDHQGTSMMPEGLAGNLSLAQFNDLVAYLVSMKQ